MTAKMSKQLSDAYGTAQKVREVEKRNPRIAALSPKDRVKTLLRKKGERGQPKPVDTATKKKNEQYVLDVLESKGLMGLKPIPAKLKSRDITSTFGDKPKVDEPETGGPKEDLMEISGQLNKASKLHGNQSKRVAGVAKGMKGEAGNPYMKRSKSKYGM